MAYTKADLKHDLAAMGLTGNETILIHSPMKSIGPVEGGADTVLDAWMEFFAEGLLLLPTHTWRFINEENRVFDVRRSPCCVGILPELFRHRPGVVRSLHPTHSMAAYGKGAAAYLEGELDANTPCTPGGCYDRLRAAHGKVLLLGVTHARNTFIHSVEEVLNVPNRLTDKPMQMTVVDEAGAQHTVYMRRHYNAQQPHISEDFVKLEQAYLDCGAARNTKFGDARCILCDAEGLFRVTRHVLAPNPEAFVTEPVIPPEANQTILVVGASGFGRPMRESVHRAPIAAQALGVSEETVVTPELWAKFLNLEALHTRVLVNQAENEPERQTARALAAGLSCPVCMAALQKGWIECLC